MTQPAGPDVHRRHSIRLREYDYSERGAYFVTICVQGRQCLFGEVVEGNPALNVLGEAVAACWNAIPQHFPHVQIDAFVVMPNHIHGIVIIADGCRGTACPALTGESFGYRVPGSLPTIVRSFKSACTKRINEIRGTPGASVWQRNYYEHVIRDEDDLNRARTYIAENPLKWALDPENPAVCERI